MKNWKTTLFGIGAGLCYLGYKLLSHQTITGEDLTLLAGLIGVAFFAKDKNVTGGSTKQ
ncbi:MAG: hypothetical protein IT254_07120 [Chitinophagaceae bacterium]|nr:hypothetical protein [Chitinophagaceae bacterium]